MRRLLGIESPRVFEVMSLDKRYRFYGSLLTPEAWLRRQLQRKEMPNPKVLPDALLTNALDYTRILFITMKISRQIEVAKMLAS